MSRREIEEATVRERGRCLWVLDQIMVELKSELDRKLLIESERHVIEVKVKLARAIVAKARRGIVSGARPKGVIPDGCSDDHDAGGGSEGTAQGLPQATPPES
jgi:hypothetical protein